MAAKRAEMCTNHPDRAAVTRCAGCHKPVCEECVVSTTDGKFCSQQCAQRTADFRKHNVGKKAGKSVMSLVKLAVAAVIILVVVIVAYKVFVKKEGIHDIRRDAQRQIENATDKAGDAIENARDKTEEAAENTSE